MLEDRRLLAVVRSLEIDPGYQPTSLIVQFRDGTSSAGSLAAYAAGNQLGRAWDIAPGLRELALNPGTTVEQALGAYRSDPHVVFAEPDWRVAMSVIIPEDPDFAPHQWSLLNTGQAGGIPGSDIRVTEAWEQTTGSPSQIVAVIDSGVDYRHPDLADNMWINTGEVAGNGLDDDGNGYSDDIYGYDFANRDGDPQDDYYHGTHVAGTIAAVANNGIGISGVAPSVKIMALKFLNEQGNGLTSDAIAAVNYAVKNGATISNSSWGGGGFSQGLTTAIANASSHSHVFVAAAGNYASNNDASPFYPASYDASNILAVAATDAGDYLAWFSNYGHQSVDVGAPGVDIYSTTPIEVTPAMLDQGLAANYSAISGTSMAAPHVAGVAALVRAMHPEWSAQEVIAKIISTVDPVASLTGTTVSGGRVNAAGALDLIPPDLTPPKILKTEPGGLTTGPVSRVRFFFDEPINASTFDADDVLSFVGPDGPVPVLGISPVPGSNKQLDIDFDPLMTLGEYALVIGPHISDLSGNELDNNGDGSGGVDGDDDYPMSFTIVDSFIFPSPDVPVALSGFATFVSYLTIEQDLPIADVNLKLEVTFPRVGNLAIWLESPEGTRVNLFTQRGGDHPNLTDTVFDDEGDLPLVMGEAPFTGSFQPEELLAAFDGENAEGTWGLFVQNVSAVRNRGSINAWLLDITKAESPVNPPPETNDPPIVVDDLLTAVQNTPLVIQPWQLLANDSDPNDDPLTVVAVSNPQGGSVVRLGDGTIVFTPDTGILAPGSFRYTVSDGQATASGLVRVNLVPQYPLSNARNRFDVNADTKVSAADPLSVINFLNAFGPTPIESLGISGAVTFFYDVVRDNFIAPNDVLAVINYINSGGVVLAVDAGGGEGEAGIAESGPVEDLAAMAALQATSEAAGLGAGSGARPGLLLDPDPARNRAPALLPILNRAPAPALCPAAVDDCFAEDEEGWLQADGLDKLRLI